MQNTQEMNKLADCIGNEKICFDEDILRNYVADFSFAEQKKPLCVLRPKEADEIQGIVQWANQTKTPLVTISSGFPHFKGDTVPSVEGAAIVDLGDMKDIIRIDSRNRVALIEPGVTFKDLIPELEKKGLRLNLPLFPRVTKSVVGSVLEREPGIIPRYHWDGSDPLCCTEIVYGTGDKFRTGSAAGSGDLEYQWKSGAAQVAALGPTQADFHRLIQGSQGTMGVVTWISLRCERIPKQQEPYFITSEELNHLISLNHWLNRLRLVDECFILNDVNFARMTLQNNTETAGRTSSAPNWVQFYNVAGYEYYPDDRISYQKELAEKYVRENGLEPCDSVLSVSSKDFLDTVQYPPTKSYWKINGDERCHDVFFICTMDKLEKLIKSMRDIANRVDFPANKIGIYIQPIVQGTSCHCEFNLFYSRNSEEEEKARTISENACKELSVQGAFFSRPYGTWAEIVYEKSPDTVNCLKKVKNIFDPNNIMNTGKLCF